MNSLAVFNACGRCGLLILADGLPSSRCWEKVQEAGKIVLKMWLE